MIEFRITYLDTQRAAGDEDNQIRGISIIDTESGAGGGSSLIGNTIMGFPSTVGYVKVTENPGFSTYAELVTFFTGGLGRSVTVNGPNAGTYNIISTPVFTPPAPSGGFVEFTIDIGAPPVGSSGNVTWTDNSVDELIELVGTGAVEGCQIIDNSEDVFTPIRSRQLNVEFISSALYGAITFATGPDDKWKVYSWINDPANIDFVGFLVTDGMQRSFQPHPTVVQLTASDKIPALKDLPLTDTDGINPQGKWRIAQYLAWCLAKTGLDLPIYVVNNIRHSATALVTGIEDLHLYDAIYLDARTFEKIIGTSEDCYTVLSKILGEDCFIQQAKGSWWIKRIGEYETSDFKIALFDSDGAFNSFLTDAAQTKNIGAVEAMLFAEANEIVRYRRPYSFVKETYKFENPLELLCNMDWSRGVENTGITPPDEVIDSISYPAKAFDPECWEYIKGFPVLTQDSVGYVKKYYKNDDELGRYLHCDTTAATGLYYWKCTNTIPVNQGDKFDFSIDVRYGTDLGGGSGHLDIKQAWLRLFGNDGTYWNLHADFGTGSSDPGPRWVQSDVTWLTNTSFVRLSGDASSLALDQWNNCSGTTAVMPVGGELEIYLMNDQSPNSQSKDFTNLRLDYIPLINGTYARYTGQYHNVSQTGNYKANRDKQVYISDSPTKLFKGAMQIYSGAAYFLSTSFFDSIKDPTGADPKPFGELQAQAVWNQFRNEGRTFSGSIRYMDTNLLDADGKVDVPEPIHKYFLTDADSDTTNKTFILISYDRDNKSQIWSGTLIECFDSVAGKVNGTHLFAYTMQQ